MGTTFLGDGNINTSSPFPDGQPHVAFPNVQKKSEQTLRCRITSPEDLVNVGLAVEVLKHNKCPVHLEIMYLMGARMDRRLSDREPYTLKYVANTINSWGVEDVRIFCPHSKTSLDLIDNSEETGWEDSFYDLACINAVRDLNPDEEAIHGTLDESVRNLVRHTSLSLVFPDEGAHKRYSKSHLIKWWNNAEVVVLSKDREERTGIVRGMKIISGTVCPLSIIIDDLCDGGATFKGAAKVLKENGANKVALVVAHGIFSKGLPIEGVDWVGSTNSFCEHTVGGLNYFYKFV